MNLKEKIQNNLTNSLKTGEKTQISVLRQILAAIHNLEIDKKAKKQELSEADILGIIRREVKKRTEAIELFSQGKREDLVEQEKQELRILQEYLPPPLSDSEIEAAIDKLIQKEEVVSPKDFGRLMGILMKEFSSRAEPAKISEILKKKLTTNQAERELSS